MKRALVVSLLLIAVAASSSFAYIGSRQAGMGGTGVASAVGLNAVAYNPAGIMSGPRGQFLLSAGAANQGLADIVNGFSNAADPAKFMSDNYSNKLDANGSLDGILGFGFNHVGISLLLPSVMANISKPANSVAGNVTALGTATGVLTLGRSFTIPGVPIGALDVGANIKALNVGYGTITIPSDPTLTNPTVNATQTIAQGSGTGFDLGARATIQIPMVTDFSVGLALLDQSETINYTPKTRSDHYTYNASGNPTHTSSPETTLAAQTVTMPTTTSLGCAGTVPGIGLKFAVDLNSISGGTGILATASDSITHIGLEYPLMLNALLLRAGVATGTNVNQTTWGAKINLPFLTLEMANVIDNKNSKNTTYTVDLGVAF
jgi:hypothetical protein